MSIEELTKVLEVPNNPVEIQGGKSWAEVESEIASRLPDDYKAYIQQYGTGYIADYLVIWNPFASLETVNLITQLDLRLKDIRRAKDNYRESFGMEFPPYPIFPEEGGILPFGATINGHIIFWKTTQKPNNWTIVISKSRSTKFEEHVMNTTEFLTNLMLRRLENTAMYGPDFEPKVGFVPMKPK